MLIIHVRGWDGLFRELKFIVDTGSGISTIPTITALDYKIAHPSDGLEYRVHTATGVVRQHRRAGSIVVRIPGLPGREFVWPCHFIEQQGVISKPALGLAGVLDDLRITFDGGYSLQAPHGTLILETIGRLSGPRPRS